MYNFSYIHDRYGCYIAWFYIYADLYNQNLDAFHFQ